MARFHLGWAAYVVAWAFLPATIHAAPQTSPRPSDEVAALRAALEALKSEYTNRVSALEARISQLEAAGASAPEIVTATNDAPAGAEVVSDAPPPRAAASGAAAFNPSISMILAGNYASLSEDPGTYRIAGFIPNDGEIGPGERSFNLGESELTVAANVDPYFFGALTAAVSGDDEIEVEEAFVRTLALHNGFTAKGGRFFSGVGYLNEIHAHAWDFVDQPLMYQAFLGGQLAQDGVQVKWLAPTETFVEFGAETGNGRSFPGTRRNRNGLNGHALFAHVGGDFGASLSWRGGLSRLEHRAADRLYADLNAADAPVVNSFTGKARTWVLDGTLKWAPRGDAARQQLKVQGEYLRRRETGQLAFDIDAANLIDGYRSSQSGWYLQTVYQFRPRWRIGGRFDALRSGSPRILLVASGALTAQDFPMLRRATPNRLTTMLDWSPSEFSRLRAQFAWDDARDTERDQQFLLQYIFSVGAHGAHKF